MNQQSHIAKLIKGCKSGDRNAQKEMYLQYADQMMGIAIRYANDFSSAKDLVQETFIKVFQGISKFAEGEGTLGGWMSRILINQALQKYRRNQKVTFVEESSLLFTESADLSIIDSLAAEDILKLLLELPAGCRMIFNLHVIEGYKHSEIGELLNISASASRSQLTRAKKLLRELLKDKKKVTPLNNKKWKSDLKRS